MSFQNLPLSLPMDNLFLDVRLDAIPILRQNIVDLTGIKTFSVGMMRDNKGFGITDINIETKASLQPIVDITFKDLYGNTVFDMSNNNNIDPNDPNRFDYSLLFDWPPPKFRFTFKGYLGQPVTWIMNLKKTNTRYNSSDGSYEIKASFVPNQWGFLADIPFLYLLAKKRLKRDLVVPPKDNSTQNKIESIFDIIKIGKTIEIKTQQISTEFDKLEKQLSVLLSNSIEGLSNKCFEKDDVITGQVAGRQTIAGVASTSGQNDLPANFNQLTITLPPSLSTLDSTTLQDTLKSLKSDPIKMIAEHQKIISIIGSGKDVSNNPALNSKVIGDSSFSGDQYYTRYLTEGTKKINDDLTLIGIEKNRRLFQTTSTQLGAVTISEVFSRLAADGAFILGSILDAGYKGYNENTVARTQNKVGTQPLIGRYFPLTINQNTGEQEPASDKSIGINNAGCEMDFVNKFIGAISEGIASNQIAENNNVVSSPDDKLVARINNLEIINPNPYKNANAQQIMETILVRSGIAAYITRSNDPNQPGDYGNSVKPVDNDSADEMQQLTDKELKNIPNTILSTLSSDDVNILKNFCTFFINLFDPAGYKLARTAFRSDDKENKDIDFTDANLIKSIEVYNSVPQTPSTSGGTASGNTIVGKRISTVGDYFSNNFLKFTGTTSGTTSGTTTLSHLQSGATSIFYQGSPKGNSDSINFDTFKAGYLYNNNTLWMIVQNLPNEEPVSYVVFSNASDKSAIDGIMNNDTDSSFNNKKKQETEEPLGIVRLSNAVPGEDNNPEEWHRLKVINEHIQIKYAVDYQTIKSVGVIPTKLNNGVLYPDTTQLNNGKGIFVASPYTPSNIGNGIDYLAYSKETSDSEPYLTWGLFRYSESLGDVRGRNQRIFLRRICVDVLNRLGKIEDQNNDVLSQVLGKANSAANSIYIQMHHIFHQWGILGYAQDSMSSNTNKSSDGSVKITEQLVAQPGEIAITLEKKYGTIVEISPDGKTISTRSVEDLNATPTIVNTETADGGAVASEGFRYDFPSERILSNLTEAEKTNVGHSIINIESLYKPNANTTLLNIIQQICTKNNFMFIPIPGNFNYTNITGIFKPSLMSDVGVGNIFHVLFTPSPESRIKENNGDPISHTYTNTNFDAFEIKFGSPDNSIIKNIDIGTDESRPTAESILNLQRLVDKDNSNKAVTTDCSILSVMEGRSFKMKVDMIGNAQISPMQYFYVPQIPIFSGLYQIMNVTHSIKPNDMTTSFEGIKMRFDVLNKTIGIKPITLESLQALVTASNIVEGGVNTVAPSAYANVPENINTVPDSQTPFTKQQFVQTYYPLAKNAGLKFKINPTVILAQAALESQWGNSYSAKYRHNFFGITAGKTGINEYWDGQSSVSTSSNISFRIYNTSQDSFFDFARLISTNYPFAASVSNDSTQYAHAIANSPYIFEGNGDNRPAYEKNIISNSAYIDPLIKNQKGGII